MKIELRSYYPTIIYKLILFFILGVKAEAKQNIKEEHTNFASTNATNIDNLSARATITFPTQGKDEAVAFNIINSIVDSINCFKNNAHPCETNTKIVDTTYLIIADFNKDGLKDKAYVLKQIAKSLNGKKVQEGKSNYSVRVELTNKKSIHSKEIALSDNIIALDYDRKTKELEVKLQTDTFGSVESRFKKQSSIFFKYSPSYMDFIVIKATCFSINLTMWYDYLRNIKEYDSEEYSSDIWDTKNEGLVLLKNIHYSEKILPVAIKLSNIDLNKLIEMGNESPGFKRYIKSEVAKVR